MIGIKIEIHFSCQLDGVFVLHQRKIFGLAQTNFKNGETLLFLLITAKLKKCTFSKSEM